MGISRKVWEATGGFKFDRLAEDIELSVRMRKAGFRIGLIPEAFVYHKRRTALSQFFRQVEGFGRGRVRVGKAHPEEIKPVHWLPSLVLLDFVFMPFVFIFNVPLAIAGYLIYGLYFLLLFGHCLRVTGSLPAAILSIPSAMVQFFGYGWGFLSEMFRR